MVKRIFFILVGFHFFVASIAADFTAHVDQNEVGKNDSLQLSLSLSGAQAKGHPDLSVLQKDFVIQAQQQSSRTTVINGLVTSNIGWQITLAPKQQGTITIPSISLETSQGQLKTSPIEVQVTSHVKKIQGVHLSAEIKNKTPYQNEPIIYTVKLTSRYTLANLEGGKLEVENTIVEKVGDEKVYESLQDGMPVQVIELNFKVTPLKSGTLTLPPVGVRATIPVKTNDPFDNPKSDPFSSLSNFSFGLTRFEPVYLETESITLNVKPPVPGIIPWMPAKLIVIQEEFENNQPFKVGEPITRTFTIIGENIAPRQLPSLENQQPSTNFKVYADKPEIGSNWRKESYTLIPQESGTLTLPEIKVDWWNTETDNAETALIPARQITVAPVSIAVLPVQETESLPVRDILITFFSILAIACLVWIIWKKRPKRKANTAQELKEILQDHAHKNWHLPHNSSLQFIFDTAKDKCDMDRDEIDRIAKSLQDALYADHPIDIKTISKQCEGLFKSTKKVTQKKPQNLNPT